MNIKKKKSELPNKENDVFVKHVKLSGGDSIRIKSLENAVNISFEIEDIFN